MAARTIELRHIVDVDGQLIGIDATVVDGATLMKRAGRTGHRRLVLVRPGRRTVLRAEDRISLREDEVLFFETVPEPVRLQAHTPSAIRLAA